MYLRRWGAQCLPGNPALPFHPVFQPHPPLNGHTCVLLPGPHRLPIPTGSDIPCTAYQATDQAVKYLLDRHSPSVWSNKGWPSRSSYRCSLFGESHQTLLWSDRLHELQVRLLGLQEASLGSLEAGTPLFWKLSSEESLK